MEINNNITINIEELLKVDDDSIRDSETIRQIGLLSCTKNDIPEKVKTILYGKIKKEFTFAALYPHVMKPYNIISPNNLDKKLEYFRDIREISKRQT